MKKKGLLIGIIAIIVIAIGCGVYFLLSNKKEKPKTDEPKEVINTYVAYVKINPSIKLEYTEKCVENQCEEPIVTNYELLNEDAKEMFKNVNLLDGDNTLANVINSICETAQNNNIEVRDVEVISDWKEIDNYLNEKKEENAIWEYTVENVETPQIEAVIETKVEEEVKATEEQQNNNDTTTTEPNNNQVAEQEEQKETTTTRDSNTIYLSDNVKANLGGEGYCCNNCFSDALIKEIKNAKGYYVTKADSSTINFEKISGLSGSYNSTKYYGKGLTDKLKAAGGENCSGFGGGQEKLTKAMCTKYHLKCAD